MLAASRARRFSYEHPRHPGVFARSFKLVLVGLHLCFLCSFFRALISLVAVVAVVGAWRDGWRDGTRMRRLWDEGDFTGLVLAWEEFDLIRSLSI